MDLIDLFILTEISSICIFNKLFLSNTDWLKKFLYMSQKEQNSRIKSKNFYFFNGLSMYKICCNSIKILKSQTNLIIEIKVSDVKSFSYNHRE